MWIVSHKVDQKLWLISRNSIIVETKETSGRIIDIDFKQELIILKRSPKAALLAKYIHKLKERHKETLTISIINNLLPHHAHLNKLHKLIAASHLIDINNLLNQTISIPIITLQPEKLAHGIHTVHMLGMGLSELEQGVDVVRVADHVVLHLVVLVLLWWQEFYRLLA